MGESFQSGSSFRYVISKIDNNPSSKDFFETPVVPKIAVWSDMGSNWPQQEIFISRVKQFAQANGYTTPRGAIKIEAVAELFHISESTLRQALHYKGKSRIRYDILASIAEIVGCSVNDFVGTAGNAPPGVTYEKWAAISERDRMFVSSVLEDVCAGTLSKAEKDVLFGIYAEARSGIQRLRDGGAGP
jgi:transcriptional regulator with XRE-family HTH domain